MTLLQARKVLGLTARSSFSDAKRTWRKLALRYHPDRGGSEATFKRLSSAWDLVESSFSEQGAEGAPPPRPPPPPPSSSDVVVGQRLKVDFLSLGGVEIKLEERAYAAIKKDTWTQEGHKVFVYVIGVKLGTPQKVSTGQVDIIVRLPGTEERGHWIVPVRSASLNQRGELISFTFQPVAQ